MKMLLICVIVFIVACYVHAQGWFDFYQFIEPAVDVVSGIFGE